MELLFLVLGGIIFGPPAILTYLGYKVLYLELSPPGRRDFLIGFFGAIPLNATLAVLLYGAHLWSQATALQSSDWVQPALLLAPWVINGGLLGLTLIFRRHVAAGMVSLFGFVIAWGVLSFVLFAVGCGVFIFIGGILSGF